MSNKELRFDSLRALETADLILIRPCARINELVEYLVYTTNSTPGGKPDYTNPIIYNIEANETTYQLRIRDETREIKFTCNGSLFESNKNMVIWSQDSHCIGTVYEHYAQEKTESAQNKKLVFRPFLEDGNTHFNISCQQQYLGHIYGNEKACHVTIRFRTLTMVEKLMLMIAGLKFFYCKYKFHQHPLPNNLLHTREASLPTSPPTLENFSNGIMRIAFDGIGNKLYAEILNAATHNIELVIEYEFSPTGVVSMCFMDVFGNLLFMSICLGATSETAKVTRGDGYRIGYINMVENADFFDSSTACAIMGLRKVDASSFYSDSASKITKIFVTGRPDDVICDIYEHITQGNIRINFLLAVSIEMKAMILSHLAFLAIFHYKDINRFWKPTVQRYPMQDASLL